MCFRKAKYHWSIDCQSTKEKCKYIVIYNQSLLAIFQLDGFNCKNIHVQYYMRSTRVERIEALICIVYVVIKVTHTHKHTHIHPHKHTHIHPSVCECFLYNGIYCAYTPTQRAHTLVIFKTNAHSHTSTRLYIAVLIPI